MSDLIETAAAVLPRPGERWAEVTSECGEGPYQALVPTEPGSATLAPLFPRETVRQMVEHLSAHLDIYGGLAWADDARTVLVTTHADDDHPRRISPDERGLYDLGLDWNWIPTDGAAPLDGPGDRELSIDEAQALGLDGTGRNGDPLHPYRVGHSLLCDQADAEADEAATAATEAAWEAELSRRERALDDVLDAQDRDGYGT